MKYLMSLMIVCCMGCATTGFDNSQGIPLDAPQSPCVKGERVKKDCNWCTCYAVGERTSWRCTKMFCGGLRKK